MTSSIQLAYAGVLFSAVLGAAAAGAQVAPAAVGPWLPGFQLPRIAGSLQYAVSASETLIDGLYSDGGITSSTNLSGNLAYLSPSEIHPLSLIYSGALIFGTNGEPFSLVQNLAFSQVLVTKYWRFTATDQVSYLPESPTVGLSGYPGLGDQGINPVETGAVTGQSILTTTTQVNNTTTGSASYRATAKTSFQASASYGLQRFTGAGDDQGLLGNNQIVGSLGGNYRIGARSSAGGNLTYSRISYTTSGLPTLEIEGPNFDYSRQWNRWLSTSASIGPQWTRVSGSSNTSINLATDATANIRSRTTSGTVRYVRGTNSGFGVVEGSFANSVSASLSRGFARVWSASANLNYTAATSVSGVALPYFSSRTLIGGLQATRAISRALSVYFSYDTQDQSTGGDVALIGAFHGLSQFASIGLTYAPRSVVLGTQ